MKNKVFNKESFCGRHALDLAPYIFFGPLIILIQPLNRQNKFDFKGFSLLTSFSILSFLMLLIMIETLQLILIKREEFSSFPIWLIFVIGGVVGAIKNSTLSWMVGKVSTINGSPLDPMKELGVSIVAWGLFVPLFAIISNQISMIRSQRLIIMDNLLLEESLKVSNEAALTQIKKSVRSAIESDVSSLMSTVRTQINRSKESSLEERYQEISKILLDSAENFVRPLSHDLMKGSRKKFPSPSLGHIFLLAFRSPIFPVLPILVLINISSVTVLIRLGFSFSEIFITCVVQSGIISILISVLGRFVPPRQRTILLTLVVLPLNVFAGNLFAQIFNSNLLNLMTPTRFIMSYIWEFSIFVIISFVYRVYKNESEVRSFVLQLIDFNRVDQALARDETLRVQYDIARYLHGNLQSRMMALGLTLKMNQQQDESSMVAAMTIADSLMNSPFAEYLDVEARTLKEEVDFAAGKWEGLLVVRSTIADLDSQLSSLQKRAIGATLEEALANALRHGFAKKVEIIIYQSDTGIVIDVLDDGVGPRLDKPGLGSRLYDSIAAKGWSLQYRLDNVGSILKLKI